MTHAYYVESPVFDNRGRQATARVCVATLARAEEIASMHPERTVREVQWNELTEAERSNLARLK